MIRNVQGKLVVVSICALFLLMGIPQTAGQSTTGTKVGIEVSGFLCAGSELTLRAVISPDADEYKARWQITYPDGSIMEGSDRKIIVPLSMAGPYRALVTVVDASGRTVAENSAGYNIERCSTNPATPSSQPSKASQPSEATHGDCYDEQRGFYDCNQPPTASPGCVTYRNEDGTYQERCETTTRPYDAEGCRDLQQQQERFATQWKYDYYAYYEKTRKEPGSDAAFEEEMRARQSRFEASWQADWKNRGCDGAYGSKADCAPRWNEAESGLRALQDRWEQLWKQFYEEMDAQRQRWASYTDDERRALEEKWRLRTEDLYTQFEAEARAFADRMQLWDCGFHPGSYGAVRPVPVMPTELPQAAPFADSRRACEEQMIAAKKLYFAEMESMREKLSRMDPNSADFAAMRERLADLERKIAAEMEEIMEDCREDYKEHYTPPENFRDGLGSLQCGQNPTSGKIECHGKYVSFVGDPNTQVLSRYSCGGQLVFDDIFANTAFRDFTFSNDDGSSALLIRSENLKLMLQDGPRGVIHAGAVSGAEFYFVPSPHMVVTVEGPLVHLAAGDWTGSWRGQDLSYDPIKRILTVRGEATWVAKTCHPDGSAPEGSQSQQYDDAIRSRRLGAQITIARDGDDAKHDEENYADMDVKVDHENLRRFLVSVDFEEGTCQTIVLKFDAGIFDTIKLRIGMTDEAGNEIEVREASHLEDILDPCDDGEAGFESWVVQDRHGTQVLLSFAHFSEKRVSVEAASVGNIVVPGFDVPLAGLALAAVVATLTVVRQRKA